MKFVTNSLGTWTRCRFCQAHAPVRTGQVAPGTLGFHSTAHGILCEGVETAVTIEAAIARDEQLNPQESAARAAIVTETLRCHGYDRHGEPCSHTAKARCRREAAAAVKQARRPRVAA
jgi:hypothetical protein